MDKKLIKTNWVSPESPTGLGGGMVTNFICLGRKWKKEKLHQNDMVGGELIEEINSMLEEYKILGRDQNDEFIWKATSTREFSIKYAY